MSDVRFIPTNVSVFKYHYLMECVLQISNDYIRLRLAMLTSMSLTAALHR